MAAPVSNFRREWLPRNVLLIVTGVIAGVCIGFSGWLALLGCVSSVVAGMAIENGVGR